MRFIIIPVLAFSVSGCASMFGGTSQEVEVVTTPPGANCAIERDGKVVGRVNPTPGTTMVEKSRKDSTIICEKAEFQRAEGESESGVEAWAFGNILIGGLIGLGIDHATGAVNDYDTPITLTLTPVLVQNAPEMAPAPAPAPVVPQTGALEAGPTS